jgi:hypothetical protein
VTARGMEDAKHFELVLRVEAVAALRFDGRCACSQHAVEPLEEQPQELLLPSGLVNGGWGGYEVSRTQRTVYPMPPPALWMSMYVAPASFMANSWTLDPLQTGWVWASTKPGMTDFPVQSMSRSISEDGKAAMMSDDLPTATIRPSRPTTTAPS